MSQTFLNLQPSETAVAGCASRIYAAYITAGRVPEGAERDWIQRSIREAIEIAYYTDHAVQSDDETSKRGPVEY